MTTVLPPLTHQPPHVTARITPAHARTHAGVYRSKSHVRRAFYRGEHRRPWSVAAKMGTLGTGLLAILVASSVFGIQLFSTAW